MQSAAVADIPGVVREKVTLAKTNDYGRVRHKKGRGVGDTGTELARQYSNFGESAKCAAPCAALGREFGPIDPELASVIEAWPSLPEAVRANVLAIVRAVDATR